MELWWFSTTEEESVEGGVRGEGGCEGVVGGVKRAEVGRVEGGGWKSFTAGQKNLIENKLSVKEKRA